MKLRFRRMMAWIRHRTPRQLRRIVIAVIGLTVLLLGIAMTILPGPAFVVIPVALAILATEFVWARRLLHRAKEMIRRAMPSSAATGRTPVGTKVD